MIFARPVVNALITTKGPFSVLGAHGCRPPIVVFTGTLCLNDVLDDLQIRKSQCSPTACVHSGFLKRTNRLFAEEKLKDFFEQNDDVVIAGYSLGGAVAAIAAYLVTRNSLCRVKRVYTFGAPAVGDEGFVEEYDQLLKRKTYRVVLANDVIPRSNWRFEHVGEPVVFEYDGRSVVDNHSLLSYKKMIEKNEEKKK